MPDSLKWFASNVKATFKRPIADGLTNVAMLVRRQARRNLTVNRSNDTKFLWNSIYVATPEKQTPIAPDGKYLSTKTGRMVERKSGPIVQPTDGAHVGVAAEYGIYVELDQPFLYPAVEQVAGRQAEDAMVGLGTGLYVGDSDE